MGAIPAATIHAGAVVRRSDGGSPGGVNAAADRRRLMVSDVCSRACRGGRHAIAGVGWQSHMPCAGHRRIAIACGIFGGGPLCVRVLWFVPFGRGMSRRCALSAGVLRFVPLGHGVPCRRALSAGVLTPTLPAAGVAAAGCAGVSAAGVTAMGFTAGIAAAVVAAAMISAAAAMGPTETTGMDDLR